MVIHLDLNSIGKGNTLIDHPHLKRNLKSNVMELSESRNYFSIISQVYKKDH